ncbi:MAG: HlyD family efflux transporter periplasmic adaptor subunit [Deltaproteobacteria bacterium]|nr:HlyD family efflux transporter periplasmic adaptor subunit [Deltaproteobacteria bacterium]
MAGAATFSSQQYQILQLLDGRRSLEEITREARDRLRVRVSVDELDNLVSTLRSLELLVHDGSVVVPLPRGGLAPGMSPEEWFPGDADPVDDERTEVRGWPLAPAGARVAPPPLPVEDDSSASASFADLSEESEQVPEGALAKGSREVPTEQPPTEAPGEGEADEAGEPSEQDEEDEEVLKAVVSRRRRRLVRLAVAVGVLGLLVGAAALTPFRLWVNEPCELIPGHRTVVRSQLDGLIRAVGVREGQWVKRGQRLVELDDRELRSDIDKLRARVRRATAELARLQKGARREEIAQARQVVATKATEVRFAQLTEARNRRLASQSLVSKERLEAASRDLAVRRREFEEARAALALLLAGNRSETIDAKKTEIEQYRSELRYRQLQLGRATVTSPIDGRVVTPRMEEKENIQVRVGDPLVEIVDTSVMRAEIQVPERELDAVRVGLPVEVKVRSYPERSFWGKVVSIGQKVEVGQLVNSMRVVSELHNPGEILKPEMTGNAKIYCGKRSVLHLATRRLMRWMRVEFVF